MVAREESKRMMDLAKDSSETKSMETGNDSDEDFLEYLDRFTLRTEQLANNLL
jgi:hypothetical protein